jgi:acyl-CoA synthetase (AMP-forming)/AMP-acid ligase II
MPILVVTPSPIVLHLAMLLCGFGPASQVLEAAVIAMPSERWGERPLLVVVPKAAGSAGTQGAAWCHINTPCGRHVQCAPSTGVQCGHRSTKYCTLYIQRCSCVFNNS